MRKRILAGIIPMGLGLIALLGVAGNTRFESYYKPDVLTLVGSGMFFGVGLVFLFVGMGDRAHRGHSNLE